MNVPKLISLIIGATLALILIANIVAPVISTAENAQKITYNNLGFSMDAAEEDINFSWIASGGITIGSESIPQSAANASALIVTDSGFLRCNSAGTTTLGLYIGSGTIYALANITACTISVDVESKTVTLSDIVGSTPNTVSWTYADWCFVPSLNGNYVSILPNALDATMYSSTDADIYSIYHSGGVWGMSLKNSELTTKSSATPDYTVVDNGASVQGADKLDRYTISTTATNEFGVVVAGTQYAPDIIVFEKSATGYRTGGESIIPMLGIIPILLIVVVAVSFVGFIRVKRA